MFAVGIVNPEVEKKLANCAAKLHKSPVTIVDQGVEFGSE